MENIPPTANAMLQHARRAAYQASVWTTSENTQQRRPAPEQQEMGTCLDDTADSKQSMLGTG